MAIFPVEIFTNNAALVGYDDRYTSHVLNEKFGGTPKGCYVGFTPSVSPPSPILTLLPDPTEGYSLLKVPSKGDPGGLDLLQTDPVTLDFTGEVDFPYYVLADATYTNDADTPTTGRIFARAIASGPVADNEVLICQVTGSPAALAVAFSPQAGERDEPLALTGRQFGFMPAGSVEDLQAAADAVAEVVAARTGLDGVTYPALKDRIDADYGAPNMAERLALVPRTVRGNDLSVPAGASSVVVSGSFSEINRDFRPIKTFPPGGSETQEGVITGSVTESRNVVLLVDAETGYRPLLSEDGREVVFGRLIEDALVAVTGEITFTNAQTDVTGVDSQFQNELQVGDALIGPDGFNYEIAAIPSQTTLILRNAYTSATESSDTVSALRLRLEFKTLEGGVESTVSFPTDKTLRAYYLVFTDLSESVADYDLIHQRTAERSPTPAATTTVPGKALLGRFGARAGAVFIQNSGVDLAGGPFHTLNFVDGTAAQVDDGEVSVTEIGQTGLPGPPGASGGPGPPGADGPGYDGSKSLFENSSQFVSSGPLFVSSFLTGPVGHEIRFISGGISFLEDNGFWTAGPGTDEIEITDIFIVGGPGGDEGQLDFSMLGDLTAAFFCSTGGNA